MLLYFILNLVISNLILCFSQLKHILCSIQILSGSTNEFGLIWKILTSHAMGYDGHNKCVKLMKECLLPNTVLTIDKFCRFSPYYTTKDSFKDTNHENQVMSQSE